MWTDNDRGITKVSADRLKRSVHNEAGLTLVELVVAAGLTTLLAAFLLTFSGRLLDDWNRSSGKLAAYQEARLALDVFKRDLQSMVFRADGREWLRSLPASVTPGSKHGDWLMFYAHVLDHDSEITEGSGLCAVSYRLARRDPITGDPAVPIYGLYRAVVVPEVTLSVAFDPLTPSLESFWRSAQGAVGDPLAAQGFLAANVVDFRVIYHYPDGTTSTFGEALALGPSVPQPPAVAMPQHPRSIEVILTVLSEAGVKKLVGISAEEAGEALEGLIQRYGYTFSRRVGVPPIVF